MEQERDPLSSCEIHEGGAAVLQESGRLSSTPARRPFSPRRSSYPHLGVAAEPSSVPAVLVALMLVRYRSPLAPTLTAEINRLRLPLPYVANVCFRYFSRFKGTL
jgi:hypothetical protein